MKYRLSSQPIFNENNKIHKESFAQKIVKQFDLKLLRDKVCLNIILGLSCADFAEFNFIAITPLILLELNYSTTVTASILSIMAIADIALRFLSPFIEHFFRQKPRVMLMYSLGVFIFARLGNIDNICILRYQNQTYCLYIIKLILFQALINSWSYTSTVFAASILGMARGITNVYWNVVITNAVPISRLSSALGLQMVTGSILLVSMGFLIGLLRDMSGNYLSSIIFLNVFSSITLLSWTIEMLCTK